MPLVFTAQTRLAHSWLTQLALMRWITFAEIYPVHHCHPVHHCQTSRLADPWLSDPELRGKRCPSGEQL